jgi:tellurite resistance protein TehA-like permease
MEAGRTEAVEGDGLRALYPGYFALAMATGITSTVLRQVGRPHLSVTLLVVDIVCFLVLCGLYALRVVRFPRAVLADLAAPDRAYAFFTFVAACNVLGARLAADGHRSRSPSSGRWPGPGCPTASRRR